MDSITQIVLGAAVGELTMGRKIGNKAQLLGAVAGTIPDLDIVMNLIYKDDLSRILIHRSYSHALLTHFILSIPLAWWCFVAFKKRFAFNNWYKLWFLGLSTHALLDACTTYGTRLFLPFSDYQVGFNNISVIDPFYTMPFMVLLAICLFKKREDPERIRWAKRAVYVSTAYMAATFFVKWGAHNRFERDWKSQGLAYEHLYTSPTFFNNALWAGIATNDSDLFIGEYSFFEGDDRPVEYVTYKRNLQLEKGFEGRGLKTLKWFSQGKYFLQMKDSNTLAFFMVKWGRSDFREKEPSKAFFMYYEIKRDSPDEIKTISPEFDWNMFADALQVLYKRIWNRLD